MAVHTKFSIPEILALFAFACVFEVISLVPGLNVLSAIIQWSVVVLVFHFKGVSFFKNRKVVTNSGVALVFGLIPVLSMLPEFIIALALNIKEANKIADRDFKKETISQRVEVPNRIERMR